MNTLSLISLLLVLLTIESTTASQLRGSRASLETTTANADTTATNVRPQVFNKDIYCQRFPKACKHSFPVPIALSLDVISEMTKKEVDEAVEVTYAAIADPSLNDYLGEAMVQNLGHLVERSYSFFHL